MELMHIGAQPVPPSLIKRWKQYFPHHQYDTNYGLSESIGPGCVHLGVENIHKVGAIGKPGYGWQARIVDSKGSDVKRGEVGELIVKGPGVMTCYYRDEEATKDVLKDGWLYTGDMAMEDGFIYLVDRKKDVIITGGENIYPVQIEDFLRSCEWVKDVAVIGRAHKRLGEIVSAIIELKEDADCTEADIAEFCNALPRYKRPYEIIFDKVPRNPTGKSAKAARSMERWSLSPSKSQNSALYARLELRRALFNLSARWERHEQQNAYVQCACGLFGRIAAKNAPPAIQSEVRCIFLPI